MAQAECIITAIRELMSRGLPAQSTSSVRLAYIEFVAALAGNVPRPIYADVDSEDLNGRADHLEKVFAALHVYLAAIIADTASPANPPDLWAAVNVGRRRACRF